MNERMNQTRAENKLHSKETASNPTIGHWRNADLTLQELRPSHSDRLIKWRNKTAETIFRSEEN